KMAYHCMAQDDDVAVALWFTLQDGGSADTELNRYGLMRSNRSQKPAFGAFKDVATNGDRLTGDCGDFSGPSIKVGQPTAGAKYSDHLVISASASDPQGLSRITFIADGQKLRNFTKGLANGKAVSLDWQGSRHLS